MLLKLGAWPLSGFSLLMLLELGAWPFSGSVSLRQNHTRLYKVIFYIATRFSSKPELRLTSNARIIYYIVSVNNTA